MISMNINKMDMMIKEKKRLILEKLHEEDE